MNNQDDLPWPELGNVSRGATRGNQGQKGVLGPADPDGRAVLQLRVQPGVLAVRLNRQSSDWYRTLDNEVNRALKLTKTYWRKARRRQDYDARADQDHMELHEWLQQLKDKTMSHLELLMQKGDIQGPPYTMPDDIELTFLRKFIQRQASGIPHNPRLRKNGEQPAMLRDVSDSSLTPEPSDRTYLPMTDGLDQSILGESSDGPNGQLLHPSSRTNSPSNRNIESVMQEANSSRQDLLSARTALQRAQKDTQDAFLRYTACLDTERQARQEVAAAEKRRDDIMSALLSRTKPGPSRRSSVSGDEQNGQAAYHLPETDPTRSISLDQRGDLYLAKLPQQQPMHPHSLTRQNGKMDWPDAEAHGVYDDSGHLDDPSKINRKHARNWDRTGLQDSQYGCEDMTALPPRKRVHHMMSGFDVLNSVALQSQTMALS